MASQSNNQKAASGQEGRFFGFREVEEAAKAGMVREVFDRVASRYDLMNDLMSGGVHRLWKDRFVAATRPSAGRLLLDVAGGTGDIAFRWLERAGPGGKAIVCDINAAMLAVGRDRGLDRGLTGYLPDADSARAGLTWVCGDATALPVPDRSVDVITIAFGLRNVTDIDAALSDAVRALRPGGQFFCLEFSHVILPGLRQLYDAWSFAAIPAIGRVVAGDADSYQYLVESIRQFPDQDSLAARMQAAGLERVRYQNLTGGVAAIHSGCIL